MPQQITHAGFCALGGLTNPRLFSRACHRFTVEPRITYWMMPL